MNDVTGLAVALTATARTRAQQLARDLQAAQRRLNRAGAELTAARQAYARAADSYRDLYTQAAAIWTADELACRRCSGTSTPAGAAPEGRSVTPPRAAIIAVPGASRALRGLWITVWQARYRDGDAGCFPSPLRREVPVRIHRHVPRNVSRPRIRPTSPTPHRLVGAGLGGDLR